ncbi:hypothetical protein, partial [Camelimonas fluminis]
AVDLPTSAINAEGGSRTAVTLHLPVSEDLIEPGRFRSERTAKVTLQALHYPQAKIMANPTTRIKTWAASSWYSTRTMGSTSQNGGALDRGMPHLPCP